MLLNKVILLLLLLLLPLKISNARATNFTIFELDSLALKCFKTNDSEKCIKALEYSERLQRFAASEDNYSCQTHLLGLGGYLIMSDMKLNNQKNGLAILEEVRNLCREL